MVAVTRRVVPTNAERTCPECGAAFTAHHGRQVFCTAAHKAAFDARNKARGMLAVPLIQTWRKGRHRRNPDGVFAFGELCALGDAWNAEDAAAGRQPAIVTAGRRARGWKAVDSV